MAILMTREQLVDKIRDSERTRDGYYWCPWFIKETGLYNENDKGYYYEFRYFSNKVIFSEYSIDMFLSKVEMNDSDFSMMLYRDNKFFYDNKDLLNLSIKDRVPGTDFILEELIDCFYYIIK